MCSRDPVQLPSLEIAKLMTLFCRLVSNRVTLVALTHQVSTLHFRAGQRESGPKAMVLVPLNWLDLLQADRWEQLAALVSIASHASDYHHGRLADGDEAVQFRARAYQAEYLRTLRRYRRFVFKPTSVQKELLEQFPKGLAHCREGMRDVLHPFVDEDFACLAEGQKTKVRKLKEPTMSRLKEIAKFACGAEAFHAFVHAVLWLSGTTLTVFGITATPAWNSVGLIVNWIIALALGLYAWRPYGRRTA